MNSQTGLRIYRLNYEDLANELIRLKQLPKGARILSVESVQKRQEIELLVEHEDFEDQTKYTEVNPSCKLLDEMFVMVRRANKGRV